jgi:hypothetical protein
MSELQQTIHAKDPLAEFERQYKGSKEAIPESLTEDSTDELRKSPDGDDEKGYQTKTHRNSGDDNILSSMNYQTEQRPGSLENIDPSVTQDGNAMIRDLEKNWDNKDANNSEIKINVNKSLRSIDNSDHSGAKEDLSIVTYHTNDIDPKSKRTFWQKTSYYCQSPLVLMRKYTIFPIHYEKLDDCFTPWYPVTCLGAGVVLTNYY